MGNFIPELDQPLGWRMRQWGKQPEVFFPLKDVLGEEKWLTGISQRTYQSEALSELDDTLKRIQRNNLEFTERQEKGVKEMALKPNAIFGGKTLTEQEAADYTIKRCCGFWLRLQYLLTKLKPVLDAKIASLTAELAELKKTVGPILAQVRQLLFNRRLRAGHLFDIGRYMERPDSVQREPVFAGPVKELVTGPCISQPGVPVPDCGREEFNVGVSSLGARGGHQVGDPGGSRTTGNGATEMAVVDG